MSKPREAAKEYAAKLVEAYEKDIATGNAPGITLRDLAETIIQDAIDETALAVGEAMAKVMLKAVLESWDAGQMAKTLDKVDKRMEKIAAEHGPVTDPWTYFYRFARAVGCERILYFTADRSPSFGLPDEMDWAPCKSEGLAILHRIHAVAIQRYGKKAEAV